MQFSKCRTHHNDIVECPAVDQAVLRLNHYTIAGLQGLPIFTSDRPSAMNLPGSVAFIPRQTQRVYEPSKREHREVRQRQETDPQIRAVVAEKV